VKRRTYRRAALGALILSAFVIALGGCSGSQSGGTSGTGSSASVGTTSTATSGKGPTETTRGGGVPLPQPYDYPPADGILKNGSFERGLSGWQVYDQKPTRSPGNNTVDVTNWAERGGKVLHVARSSDRDGGGCGVFQRPNYDCSHDTHLWVTYQAYVNFEQGGNIAGKNPNQFPESGAQARVKYLDASGAEHEWYDGVFITPTTGADTARFLQARDNEWTHRVGQDLMTLNPKPVKIVEVRFYGFGWGFDSMFDDCQVVTGK
jgi:hypothetical protein